MTIVEGFTDEKRWLKAPKEIHCGIRQTVMTRVSGEGVELCPETCILNTFMRADLSSIETEVKMHNFVL